MHVLEVLKSAAGQSTFPLWPCNIIVSCKSCPAKDVIRIIANLNLC